jgi:hypothetical protein
MNGKPGAAGSVTVTRAVADQTYNGEGYVVGPKVNGVVQSLTLGNTDGATAVTSSSNVGHWSGTITNATELGFVDWPATIVIDNLAITTNPEEFARSIFSGNLAFDGIQRATTAVVCNYKYGYATPFYRMPLLGAIDRRILRLQQISRGERSKVSSARAGSACTEGLSKGAPGISERRGRHAERCRAVLPHGDGIPGK